MSTKKMQIIGLKGKSAYQYAQDGGYTGTEAEFKEKMAKELDTVYDYNNLNEAILATAIKPEVSGEFIHIADSAALPIMDFGMEGKTEQFTTSGKNLFDINGDINQYYPGTIMSANSNVLNDDGTITVNASTSVSVGCGFKIEGIAGKTLTISFDVISVGTGTGVSSSICIPTQTNYDIKSNISAGKKLVLTKTFGEDINEAIFTFITQSGTGGIIKNIQIEAGSTATDYEPYTGAQPSPNPDYPQEIINAGAYNEATGRYEIGCKVVNKNLFNCGNSIPSSLGIVDGNIFKTTAQLNDIFSNLTNAVFEENTQYVVAYSKSIVFKDTIAGIQVHIVYTDGTYDGFYMSERGTFSKTSKANKTIKCIQSNNPFGTGVEYENMQIYKLTDGDEYIPPHSQPFTLTSPVPITKWDKLVKRNGVYGWSIYSEEVFLKDYMPFYINGVDYYASKSLSFKCKGSEGVSRYFKAAWLGARYPFFCVRFDIGIWLYNTSFTTTEELHQWIINNNVSVIVVKFEPTFHPLPDNEQALLKSLETYYQVTNIYNDQNCPMSIQYIADTQTYIDNLTTSLTNAVVSLGGEV